MMSSPLVRHGIFCLTLMSAILLGPPPVSGRVLELVDQAVDTSLGYPGELAISPDDRYVYFSTAATTIRFVRDQSTGELAFVDADAGALSIAISPDGRAYYSQLYGSVRAYLRDIGSGALGLLETWEGPKAFGIQGVTAVHLSPDGRHAYVTLYDGIAIFARDPGNGVLTWVETLFDGVGDLKSFAPSDLAFSADGAYLYVTSAAYFEPSGLMVFARDATTGALTRQQFLTNETASALEKPEAVRLSDDGRNVYLLGPQAVVTLQRNDADGTVSFLGAVGNYGYSTLAVGPDDRFVYAFRSDDVEIYSRDAGTGALALVESIELQIAELATVAAAKFSSDGRHLYLATSNLYPHRGGVAVFSHDPASGSLSLVASYLDDVDGDADDINDPRSAVVSPDGRHLYVGAGGAPNELAAFSRSPVTGKLDYLASYGNWSGGAVPASFADSLAMSPDGRYLYVAADEYPECPVVVLTRDEVSGELDFVESYSSSSLQGVLSLALSPDARHLYVTASADALAVFEREPESGRLTLLETMTGIPGLEGATAVAIDAGGNHVYVSSWSENSLTVFDRDADSGGLSFLEIHEGVEGLGYSGRIAFSPDGRNLYAGRDRLSVFARDPATGRLALLEQHPGYLGNPYLSDDGEYVFAFRNSMSVYHRDPGSGRLTLVESGSFPAGYSASTMALSPDGKFVHVGLTSYLPDAVNTYRIQEGPCRANWDGLCLGDDRFRVEIDWRDFVGNTGTASPVLGDADNSGVLWFFGPNNWEMQIKVLNACDLNDRFWVFAAATTNVEYTLRVTDVVAGTTKTYFNPLGNAASAITDTDAFATCSGALAAPASAATTASIERQTSAAPSGSPVVRSAYRRARPGLDKSDHPGLVKGLGDKCLDVEGGSSSDGSPVVLYDCHGNDNQRWEQQLNCSYHCSDDFELRVFGDKCLQPGPDTGSGFRRLEIGSCDGSDDLWLSQGHYPQEFSLVHEETGLCADVLGASTDNRTPIILFDCRDQANQRWSFDEYTCESSPTGTCKNSDRFLVEVEWRDFAGKVGKGRVLPEESDDSGLFWFFGPDNWEMLVKVLDGCGINDQYWVFAAATTNVEYTLRVTDTETNEVREYFNPLGNAAPAITDTSAFAACSEGS